LGDGYNILFDLCRLATAAVERTAGGNAEGQKITLNVIKQRLGEVLYKLTSQKFEDPGEGGSSGSQPIQWWWWRLLPMLADVPVVHLLDMPLQSPRQQHVEQQ
jgi:hypothetical protein